MKILVPEISEHAGKWIYEGYAKAWENLGHEVERYSEFNFQDADVLMIYDHLLSDKLDFAKYKKVFLFVSFNNLDMPYGSHINFVSAIARNLDAVEKINGQENIVKWTFVNPIRMPGYFDKWVDVEYIPLAYDSLSYSPVKSIGMYDVCFIGGSANNGFNTKQKIMLDIFSDFKKSGLRCGFFLNSKLTHNDECRVLTNSKVCINIHDAYQRELGLDINERTFKALGLNGNLISDYVEEGVLLLGKQFFHRDSKMVDAVQGVLSLSPEAKEENRNLILNGHTYVDRVKQMIEFI
jgi:hypothetical protein